MGWRVACVTWSVKRDARRPLHRLTELELNLLRKTLHYIALTTTPPLLLNPTTTKTPWKKTSYDKTPCGKIPLKQNRVYNKENPLWQTSYDRTPYDKIPYDNTSDYKNPYQRKPPGQNFCYKTLLTKPPRQNPFYDRSPCDKSFYDKNFLWVRWRKKTLHHTPLTTKHFLWQTLSATNPCDKIFTT